MYQQKRKHSHLVLLLITEQLLPSISAFTCLISITLSGLPPNVPNNTVTVTITLNQTYDTIFKVHIDCVFIIIYNIVNDCELKQNIVVFAQLCHDLPVLVLNRPWPKYISDPWGFSCPAGGTADNLQIKSLIQYNKVKLYTLLELCPLECCMFVVRVLQCCKASLTMSEMNFCADTDMMRTIRGSTVPRPDCK